MEGGKPYNLSISFRLLPKRHFMEKKGSISGLGKLGTLFSELSYFTLIFSSGTEYTRPLSAQSHSHFSTVRQNPLE